MAKSPSRMIEDYDSFYRKIGDAVMGEGSSTGKIYTSRLPFVLLFGAVAEVMHINGIYQNRDNFLAIINSLVLYSLIIQFLNSLVRHFRNKDVMIALNAFKILTEFTLKEEQVPEFRLILTATVQKAFFVTRCYMPVCLMLYHAPLLSNWILSLIRWEPKMAFAAYLPFIDPQSLHGFLINMIMQTLISTLFCMLTVGRDQHIIFYPLQAVPMADIFVRKLQKFSRRLLDFHAKKNPIHPTERSSVVRMQMLSFKQRHQRELASIEKQLIELIKEHKSYNNYIENFVAHMGPNIFIAISANSIAIALALVYILYVSIAIGLPLALILFNHILLPCIAGTVISTQNAKILNALCDFPWYELTPKMKKVYLQFIHRCQNANEFDLPIVGQLDMELFTNVINASYSYLTFLMHFF